MLDTFAAVGVRDDEIEPVAIDELSNFAPEMTSMLRVKPDHRVSPRDRIEAAATARGVSSVMFQGQERGRQRFWPIFRRNSELS
jgi:hypothetical protein